VDEQAVDREAQVKAPGEAYQKKPEWLPRYRFDKNRESKVAENYNKGVEGKEIW